MADQVQTEITGLVEQVEELRYTISVKTYDLLRKKRKREETGALEIELESIKRKLTDSLSQIDSTGINYVFVNKRRLDDLRVKFMSLGIAERGHALDGNGRGGKILAKLNHLLELNYENRHKISEVISTFQHLTKSKDRIKRVIEGYSDFALVGLTSPDGNSRRFMDSISAIGFYCKLYGNLLYIGSGPLFYWYEQLSPSLRNMNSSLSNWPKDYETYEMIIERKKGDEFEVVSAICSYSTDELNERIQKILQSPKMKRWVLNSFKDDGERSNYLKAQEVLTILMRMKRQAKETKRKVGAKSMRVWMNGERVNAYLKNGLIPQNQEIKIDLSNQKIFADNISNLLFPKDMVKSNKTLTFCRENAGSGGSVSFLLL